LYNHNNKFGIDHSILQVIILIPLIIMFVWGIPSTCFAQQKPDRTTQEMVEFLSDALERGGREEEGKNERAPERSIHGENNSKPESKPLKPEDIKPLYTNPGMKGEGIWKRLNLRPGDDTAPAMYTTFYRPSERFPTAIAHMLLMEMKGIMMDLYLGAAEPLRKKGAPAKVEKQKQPRLLAITNALWQSRHTGRSGIIYDGVVLREMAVGKATIVVYKNNSVDLLEWNDQIPIPKVKHARQLKHLILKKGKVVTHLEKGGKKVSAEIGLGSLLNEERPVTKIPPTRKGEKPKYKLNLTSGDLWFIATRSAFGIRPDGNLVFAVGHHIGSIDLARALALAGCERGMHGDANPGNAIGILYHRNKAGKLVELQRLSPSQHKSTVWRYLKRSYPKDFFAYFKRPLNAGQTDKDSLN
jgi:hypothetical protein